MASASSIIQRVFSAGMSQPLLFRGNEFSQPLAMAEHWTKLRIGIQWAVPPVSPNSFPGQFWIGVCNQGKSVKQVNSAFIGMALGSNGGSNFQYQANSGNSYFSTSTHTLYAKQGTAYTSSTNGTPTFILSTSDAVNPRRSFTLIDITKASPFLIVYWNVAVAHTAFDLSYGDMCATMEQVNATPVLRGSSLIQSSNQTLAYSELTYGYLNCLNLYWSRWLFPLEIYGIAVYHVY